MCVCVYNTYTVGKVLRNCTITLLKDDLIKKKQPSYKKVCVPPKKARGGQKHLHAIYINCIFQYVSLSSRNAKLANGGVH